MIDDPIISEVRRIRAEILAECGGTVAGLSQRLRNDPPPRTVGESEKGVTAVESPPPERSAAEEAVGQTA